MPHHKLARMSGMSREAVHSPLDHHPYHERYAGMTEEGMREFMREEQAEGMHPSLRGKRF
jgi:hypothetical protein